MLGVLGLINGDGVPFTVGSSKGGNESTMKGHPLCLGVLLSPVGRLGWRSVVGTLVGRVLHEMYRQDMYRVDTSRQNVQRVREWTIGVDCTCGWRV
jgi:hypothetical protein